MVAQYWQYTRPIKQWIKTDMFTRWLYQGQWNGQSKTNVSQSLVRSMTSETEWDCLPILEPSLLILLDLGSCENLASRASSLFSSFCHTDVRMQQWKWNHERDTFRFCIFSCTSALCKSLLWDLLDSGSGLGLPSEASSLGTRPCACNRAEISS